MIPIDQLNSFLKELRSNQMELEKFSFIEVKQYTPSHQFQIELMKILQQNRKLITNKWDIDTQVSTGNRTLIENKM